MKWKSVYIGTKISHHEKVPYEECPNCSRHKFTVKRRIYDRPGLIFGRNKDYKYKLEEYCKHCQLRQNERIVKREELENKRIRTTNHIL